MLIRRSRVPGLGVATSLCLAMAAQALGGTVFRLEVASPIAGNAPKLKNALFVVRALACDEAGDVRMTATAEGRVDGIRQSMPLNLVALSMPATYAVVRQWPDGGSWVVNVTGSCPGLKATASAVVRVGTAGFRRESSQLFERAATRAEVEAALIAIPRGGE